jgi:outer membrane protein TolC
MHSSLSFRGYLLALVLGCAAAAWGAEPLTLADAQRIALARSQLLVANEAAASSARRMAQGASQLPDPVLKLGVENVPLSGPDRFSLSRDFMTMRRIGIMQELPSADKRRSRASRAEADATKAQAEQGMTAANVRRDSALAWLDRHYALATRQLLLQQIDEAKVQAQSAETAYRGARGSQSDVFAARAAQAALQDRLTQVDRQARGAAIALARWLGPDAERPPSGTPAWQYSYLESGITREHLSTHPDLAVAAAQVEAAQAEVRVAQANRKPDWTVEAAYSQRGPGFPNMFSVGVSIPLQVDRANRQDQELAAKLAMVEESRARYEDLLRGHEAQVLTMVSDWQAGKERIGRYTRELIPLARQRTEAALAAYRGGKADLASVLAARRDELDVRVQALNLEMETARQWAQFNFLSVLHDAAGSQQEMP